MELKMKDLRQIADDYPYTLKFFSEDWLKNEFGKNKDEKHLLARQFDFNDDFQEII
jgi:hypothetical protein